MLDCGHEPSEHSAITTGYGYDADGKTFCYECAATMDSRSMVETGRATLYLDSTQGTITNWPGSLSFHTGTIRKGKHNMARTRYDAWFLGPDGKEWHAVQYGENTQIAHCRRVGKAV